VSDNARERLAEDCLAAVGDVFAALNRSAEGELLALDLTMTQFKATMALAVFGPQPVGGLGRRLGLSEPAASLLADRLEALGLARRTRDSEDRRRTLLALSERGRELTDRLRRGRDERLRRLLGRLDASELAALRTALAALARAARELAAEEGGDGDA